MCPTLHIKVSKQHSERTYSHEPTDTHVMHVFATTMQVFTRACSHAWGRRWAELVGLSAYSQLGCQTTGELFHAWIVLLSARFFSRLRSPLR